MGVGSAPPLLVGVTLSLESPLPGVYAKGSLYSVNTNGSNFTILHSISGTDGRTPSSPLTYVNGELYGTTSFGGAYNYGNIYSIHTNGSGFAASGYTFTNGIDGKMARHQSGPLRQHSLWNQRWWEHQMVVALSPAVLPRPPPASLVAIGPRMMVDPNFSLQTPLQPPGLISRL